MAEKESRRRKTTRLPAGEAAGAVPESDPGEEIAFEEAYGRLEAVVERLEGGEPSLEESLRLLEEGIRMSRICQSRLDQAQARLEQLLEREGGPVVEPFQLAGAEGEGGRL
ncbi:exodeoxyribonuclease VII small subunit [Limnochorda pilosa]|uniref:Exodeoxyribonuclease 7 small subunit n=1 Tax=Limnochorda pilosa TaxID=1555112 RepID=A0A0K2SN42_LIMPI|nr:exodeoxyribonuclease VII small subunit [Limnochorda pilosa]BAS28422.1 exodeoxyribonuclease VII small subunit [Limnochorda pilosa]